MTRLLRNITFALVLGLQIATASFPAKESGEIAGGLVEGFIGTDDVKSCIQKTVATVGDLDGAVQDFKKKDASDVLKGLKLVGEAFETLPAALKSCKAVESDVDAIIKAIEAMTSPGTFAFHVGKDLVVNGADIFHEIYSAVADYEAKNWPDFGVQIGTALHKLIIGLETATASLPAKEAGEIAAGIVEGFIGVDDVKTCIQKTVATVGDLGSAVQDFEKKDASDVLKGLKLVGEAFETLPAALKSCKAVESDVVAIVKAIKVMTSPESFAFHVGKDLIVNGADIFHEIYSAVADYKANNWSDFGVQIGTALHKLVIGATATGITIVV